MNKSATFDTMGRSLRWPAFAFVVVCLISPGLASRGAKPTQMETTAKELIAAHLSKTKPAVDIVVGVIDGTNTGIVSDGKSGFDGDTVFEIGSVTKVFTSLLLADMVVREEVDLNDPISKYLPESVKVPTRNGKSITLVDLATHTSGLPRLPDNLSPKDPNNPYADYTIDQLYAFLSGYKLPRDIGSKYEYSNLGGGLLGHVLALKAETEYEAAVIDRICRPLEMSDTRITLTPSMKSRLAPGHDESGKPAENWDIPTLAGAGGLRSTAHDLVKFVSANMGLTKTALQPAMALAQTPRHEADSSAMQIGLGWHILKKTTGDVVWHNGGTGGYHSFVGFDKKNSRGVVVLINSADDIDEIGLKLLEPNPGAAKQRVAIKLAPGAFDACIGQYEVAPGVTLTMSRKGERLFTRMTGQAPLEIFPESETDYFLKAVDAQLTFQKNANGEVTAVVLHQDGIDQTAKKVK